MTGQLQQPENKQIAELAVTPVLLNLICSVFQGERGNLPKNRADLYKKGLRDLLEGLDESKGVQREPISEELTPEAKEDLLAYLAVTLFEANDYFPQQETLENLIIEHFQISRSKAIKVLKSIEEQSGLIVERSEGFWSFSHLTFQEYFTAKWFCDQAGWEGLIKHITKEHWREVFLLAVGMIKPADQLLETMKRRIDEIVLDDKIQMFLTWTNGKACEAQKESETEYKIAAIRANYLHIPYEDSRIDLYLARSLNPNHRPPSVELDLALAQGFRCFCSFLNGEASAISVTGWLKLALQQFSNTQLNLQLSRGEQLQQELIELVEQLPVQFHQIPPISQSVQQFDKGQMPNLDEAREKLLEWRETRGHTWGCNLIKIMINYRNIGYQFWQFNKQQQKALYLYHHANRLLVDCLNSIGEVTDVVQREIENALFLPIVEIKKRQKQMNDL